MKSKINLFAALLALFALFSCNSKTDENEIQWEMNACNQTEFDVKVEFKQSIQNPNNAEFWIKQGDTVTLFNGSNGLLADPITKHMYDSAYVYFGTEFVLAVSKNDATAKILQNESYVEMKSTADGKTYLYSITNEDLKQAKPVE